MTTRSLFLKFVINVWVIIQIATVSKVIFAQQGDGVLQDKQIATLNELSLKYYYSGSFDSAYIFADSAIQMAVSVGNTRQLARGFFFRGLSLFRKDRHTQAILDLQQSILISESQNDTIRIGVSSNTLGVVYQSMSLHEEAIKHYNKALEMWLGVNDRNEIAVALFNISAVLVATNSNLEEANKHLQRIESEYSDIAKQDKFLSNIYNSKSMIKDKLNQPDSAIYYALKAYEISIDEERLDSRMYITFNLAGFYQTKNEYTLAEKFSRESLSLREQMQSLNDVAYGKLQLAGILIKKNELEKADVLIQDCIHLAEQLENVEIKIEVNALKSAFFEAKGDYKSAMDAYKVYVALKDSSFTLEKLKQINWMRSLGQEVLLSHENELLTKQRDHEKMLKQKAIARRNLMLLFIIFAVVILVLIYIRYVEKGKLNKRLAASEAELKKLNHAKDRFFGILSHDLRNPLMAFESLSNHMTKSDAADFRALAFQMNTYAKQLINLLNNLLSWSKNEQNLLVLKPQAILLEMLIDDIMGLYKPIATAKNIEIFTECPPDLMVFTDKETLQTILRNLINNAVKFTDSGSVSINCATEEQLISVSVIDTGIGMDEQQMSGLFDLGNKHHSGLGLLLCKELADRSSITLTIESQNNKGTIVKLLIPKFVPYEDRSG